MLFKFTTFLFNVILIYDAQSGNSVCPSQPIPTCTTCNWHNITQSLSFTKCYQQLAFFFLTKA